MLQGELLDGESMGMKQVRIPLDGHHPVALFAADHVYDSQEQVTEKSSIKHTNSLELCTKTQEKYTQQPKIAHIDPAPSDDRQLLEAFKHDNWDHVRNHLRIDKLDEFYQLWRMAMTPFGFADATVTLPSHKQTPENKPSVCQIGHNENGNKQANIIQLSLF